MHLLEWSYYSAGILNDLLGRQQLLTAWQAGFLCRQSLPAKLLLVHWLDLQMTNQRTDSKPVAGIRYLKIGLQTLLTFGGVPCCRPSCSWAKVIFLFLASSYPYGLINMVDRRCLLRECFFLFHCQKGPSLYDIFIYLECFISPKACLAYIHNNCITKGMTQFNIIEWEGS